MFKIIFIGIWQVLHKKECILRPIAPIQDQKAINNLFY